MHLAVKLAEACPKATAKGLPKQWPVEVVELPDHLPTRPGPWISMSIQQLSAHKQQHQAEYDAWVASQPQE